MIGRKKSINYILVILLISSVVSACTGLRQSDIKIKDENVARLIKEAIELYEKEKYEEALDRFFEAEDQARLPEDKLGIADILSKGGFGLLKEETIRYSTWIL